MNAREKFKYQLDLLKNAITKDTLLLGDFNLDFAKQNDVNYAFKNLFEDFDERLGGKIIFESFNNTYLIISSWSVDSKNPRTSHRPRRARKTVI